MPWWSMLVVFSFQKKKKKKLHSAKRLPRNVHDEQQGHQDSSLRDVDATRVLLVWLHLCTAGGQPAIKHGALLT